MIRLAALLFTICTMFITTAHSQTATSFDNGDPSFCCDSNPDPEVVPASINLIDIVNESPNYGQVTTPNFYTKDLDNTCYSFFKIDDYSYLHFLGLRYADGSYIILKYIVSPLPGYPGVNRVQGLAQESGSSTIIYDEVYLGSACPGMRVYYRNYIAGRCDLLGNLTQTQGDFIHGDSPIRDNSDCCKSQVATVANSHQLRGAQLVALPNRLNRCCVTQFKGASCINADRVLPQDSIIVPDSGTSCSNN